MAPSASRKVRACRRATTEARDENLRLAVAEIRADPTLKPSVVARRYGVPKQTLSDRVHGKHKPRSIAHQAEQLLSPAEERVLVERCLVMQRRSAPHTYRHIVDECLTILRAKLGAHKAPKSVGRSWLERFLTRHPELKPVTRRAVDSKRVRALKPEIVEDFYSQASRCRRRR
jgi:DNA-binding transcriptional regulator YiaG